MKRFISAILVVLLFALCIAVIPASAADFGCDVSVTSNAVYLENLDTGVVVYQKDAQSQVYPASTTKIMTYIIVAESVPDFENTMVKISEEAFSGLDPESSVMGLSSHIGEEFSVKDLLYGMMVSSGNDAAWVLADYVGHGVSNFVDMMNRKAAQLHCDKTHFVNPHGLYDSKHYTTAQDLATITKYALDKPMFKEITNTTQYPVKGFDEDLKTTNYLIDKTQEDGKYYYEFAKGIKTGYTDEAGKCIVSTATKGDYNYLCVVLGSPYSQTEQINFAMYDSRNLYEWAFDNVAYQTLYTTEDKVGRAWVNNVWGARYVDYIPGTELKALLPVNYDKSQLTTDINADSQVFAPIKRGDKVGTITVSYKGEKVATGDVVVAEDIDWHVTNFIAHVIFRFIRTNIWLFVLLLIVFIIIIFSVVNAKRNKKIEKRRRRRYR